MFALAIAVPLLLALLLFTGCQRRLIYFPRPYPEDFRRALPGGTVELAFKTPAGNQKAFYVPADGKASAPPDRLWACFNGNGSLALDWLDLVEKVHAPGVGFLLVDYPGYGANEGSPSRASIREASDGALEALAAHFHLAPAEIEKRMNVLGFSLGSGTGLDFAARHAPRRVVLCAPFTSLLDMARRTVGWPLCLLLLDRFDNAARLNDLAARADPPRVFLLHGTQDEVVPFEMGRVLAERHPEMIRFRSIPGAGHNNLIGFGQNELLDELSKP